MMIQVVATVSWTDLALACEAKIPGKAGGTGPNHYTFCQFLSPSDAHSDGPYDCMTQTCDLEPM